MSPALIQMISLAGFGTILMVTERLFSQVSDLLNFCGRHNLTKRQKATVINISKERVKIIWSSCNLRPVH